MTRLTGSEQKGSHMPCQGFWSFSSFGHSEKCIADFYMPSPLPGTGDTKSVRHTLSGSLECSRAQACKETQLSTNKYNDRGMLINWDGLENVKLNKGNLI